MIDLSKREQLFFTWLEKSEVNRGFSFQAGQLKIDWQMVFSKADSRLKIDEQLKFRLFDWVSKNFKDNFFENVLSQNVDSIKFGFEPILTSEVIEKYSEAFKRFSSAVINEINGGSFNALTGKKSEEFKKEIESFGELSLLNLAKMDSFFYFDLEVTPFRKAFIGHDPSKRSDKSTAYYFKMVTPKCYDTKYSWLKRKAFSKSVVETMQSLDKYYKSKDWQSVSSRPDDDLLEQSYSLLKRLKFDALGQTKPLDWLGLVFKYTEFQPVYREVGIFLNDGSTCEQISKLMGNLVRNRINQALSHWISYRKLPGNNNTIPESVRLSFAHLDTLLTTELDKDLELGIANYYGQILEPVNHLIDYLFRTYLPFSLFYSGLIAFYQRANGDLFIGFTQNAILHHLAKQTFNGTPAQYPPARNGANPFFLEIKDSEYYDDEDDEDDEYYEDDEDDLSMDDFFKYFFSSH
jgi:hypothetical protein